MDAKDLFAARRAVNFFDTSKDVDDATMRRIVALAAHTPSSYNLQPWSLVVLREAEEKAKLHAVAFKQAKVLEAPVVCIVLANREGWKDDDAWMRRNFEEMVKAGSIGEDKWEWYAKTTRNMYGKEEAFSHAFGVKNAAFFAMSLMYAAQSLGVDSHPMDGFNHEGVREAFAIPEKYWIPCLICFGHFDQSKELSPPKWRKTYDEIVVKF